jgi:hypothetical protein
MTRLVSHRTLAEAIVSLNRGLGASKRPEDRELVRGYLAALIPILADATLGVTSYRDAPRTIGKASLAQYQIFSPRRVGRL